jgi:hypothetical protein
MSEGEQGHGPESLVPAATFGELPEKIKRDMVARGAPVVGLMVEADEVAERTRHSDRPGYYRATDAFQQRVESVAKRGVVMRPPKKPAESATPSEGPFGK